MKFINSIFTNLTTFSLCATVFALWLTVQLNPLSESYLSYFLILTVGILHGSNDLQLIKKTFSTSKVTYQRILFYYVSLVLITGIMFFIFPVLALLFFVFISAYHFGEQHWNAQVNHSNSWVKLFYTSYGLIIFGGLFYLNQQETSLVIKDLTGIALESVHYFYFLIFSVLIAIGMFSLLYYQKWVKAKILEEIFLLLVFGVIFKVASLLWAFAIYFTLWHSLPSLKDQSIELYGHFSTKGLKKYVKSSYIFWIAAITSLITIFFVLKPSGLLFITLFFAFLAAITVPHVFVMYKLNHKD